MKIKTLMCSFIISIIFVNSVYAGDDTTSDLLAIYDTSVYTPSQTELKAFKSEMDEYNKLLNKEKQIQSFNNSVTTAQEQMRKSINDAQQQVQNLLEQSVSCSTYIENNIYGDFSKLVEKDAEYKQCYRAADTLLDKVNKMDIPPLLVSVQGDIKDKEKTIEEKKSKMELPEVHKADGEFVLGDVYKIKKITDSEYNILSDYGSRINPVTAASIEYHNGIDLYAPTGTNVYSMFNGTVIEAGNNWAMGNFVRIEHGSGVISMYGHLSDILVSTGQDVSQYDLIGKSGATGANVSSDYLYLSLFINGRSVNPKILFDRGVIDEKDNK